MTKRAAVYTRQSMDAQMKGHTMKKMMLALAGLALLALAGCAAGPDVQLAMETCVEAYSPALNYTADLGGPEGACGNWLESQGEAAFTEFWTDASEWEPYIKKVYRWELASGW